MFKNSLWPALMTAGVLALTGAQAGDDLTNNFAAPSNEYKPWVYWWWYGGNASKEGITRDMEDMRDKGISGALLVDAASAAPIVPNGPPFMSEAWRELFRHALCEADRCGIAISVNVCSGWNAGGPWVPAEHAMKSVVYATTVVNGPSNLVCELPKAIGGSTFYQDIAVLAAPEADERLPHTLSASSQAYAPARAEDFVDATAWESTMKPTPEKPAWLQFDLDQPGAAAGVYLKPFGGNGPKDVEVQVSDDGQNFRSLKRQKLEPAREEQNGETITFNETRGKHFRILFLSSYSARSVGVSEISLLTAAQAARPPQERLTWDHSRMVDVTRLIDAKGQINWDVPPGRWRIIRIGSSLFGRSTGCVGSGPGGYEIDPMSAEAMDLHFANTGAKLIADAGPLAGKTLQYLCIDSWEIGTPNWTPKMLEEFRRRRGYDPLPFLPALFGWTVKSGEASAQFRSDYRRTCADLTAAHYYGRLRELSLKGGLRGTHCEAGGPFFEHWVDALQCLGVQDVPMGEYWKRGNEPEGAIVWSGYPQLKQAASAAHIYGKPLCQAETFTSVAHDFIDDPWSMKDIGDSAFCEGLTRMVFHSWTTQPDPTRVPGIQYSGHVGTHFGPTVTWWPMAKPWLTYLTRCQYMLRQGLFVADFAYLLNQDIPCFLPWDGPSRNRYGQRPVRPFGFDYDALNTEVLLTRASAKDGRLTLADGMSYTYLVLPNPGDERPDFPVARGTLQACFSQTPVPVLSDAAVKKVNELAESGVPVIGPAAWKPLVPKLREGSLADITRADGLAPDIEFRNPTPAAARFDYIHRRAGETDIYFVTPQLGQMGKNTIDYDSCADVVFRVKGKQPELWDAVTGRIVDLPQWRALEDGRIEVPMRLAPRQSFFVVFKKKESTTKVTKDTKGEENFPELKPVQELTGPWEVQFDPAWFYPDNGTGGTVRFEKLEDWSQRPEEAVKHFSGIATYRKTFDVGSEVCGLKSVVLALGTVKNLARVKLNGRDLGVVWTAPWRVEIPEGLLKAAGNELEIEVANLWVNRLAGDCLLPKEQRRTWTPILTYEPKLPDPNNITLTLRMLWTPWGAAQCRECQERLKTGRAPSLVPSGLLGPVQLLAEGEAKDEAPKVEQKQGGAGEVKGMEAKTLKGLRLSRQYEAERQDFNVGARRGFVILPVRPRADGTKPWVWYAPTFIGQPGTGLPQAAHEWMFKQLLENGFAIAGVDVGESCGNPKGRATFTQLYELLVREYGLSAKACLLPQSRGGLMLYNWAAEHPDKVRCIGGIYTVCDLASFPGLKQASTAYGMSEAGLGEHLPETNPIDRLAPLVKANVPILHVHGDKDKMVPLERNSGELVKRYRALGGPGDLVVVPGKGHEVCDEFFHNRQLVEFFLRHGGSSKR